MIIGIGTDIVETTRIESSVQRLGDRFVARILVEEELKQYQQSGNPIAFLAKRFAAKEAVVKALGTGIGNGVSWHQVLVRSGALGAPEVELSGYALEHMKSMGGLTCLLSISDERKYAIAFATITG